MKRSAGTLCTEALAPALALAAGILLAAVPVGASEACRAAAERACEEVQDAFLDDDPELLQLAFDRWASACGEDGDLLWRARILAAIWEGAYADSLLGEDPVARMLRYRLWYTDRRLPPLTTVTAFSSPDSALSGLFPCADLSEFAVDLAEQLIPFTEPDTEEELFARFFAGELHFGLAMAQVDSVASTRLRASHAAWRRRVADHRGDEYFLGGLVGLWQGAANYEDLGSRLGLGITAGQQSGRLTLGLVAAVRIGDARRDYTVRDGDDLYDTDAFTGVYLGAEPGIELLRRGSWSVSSLFGVGWQAVESLPSEPENDIPAKWIHSVARSVGLALTHRAPSSEGFYLSLQARHEWNDFDAGDDASELAGQAWEFRIVFGKHRNPQREAWRRALAATSLTAPAVEEGP